jgi:isoleucyl-tRNA synthetase
MKQASAQIAGLTQAQISTLEKEGKLCLDIEGENIELLINEVDIIAEDIPGWSVAVKNALTVALDITLSPELLQEGNARELVNRVQNIRKESNFDLTDKILLEIEDNTELKGSIIQFSDYICREILAHQIDWVPTVKDGVEVEINEHKLRISVRQKG